MVHCSVGMRLTKRQQRFALVWFSPEKYKKNNNKESHSVAAAARLDLPDGSQVAGIPPPLPIGWLLFLSGEKVKWETAHSADGSSSGRFLVRVAQPAGSLVAGAS